MHLYNFPNWVIAAAVLMMTCEHYTINCLPVSTNTSSTSPTPAHPPPPSTSSSISSFFFGASRADLILASTPPVSSSANSSTKKKSRHLFHNNMDLFKTSSTAASSSSSSNGPPAVEKLEVGDQQRLKCLQKINNNHQRAKTDSALYVSDSISASLHSCGEYEDDYAKEVSLEERVRSS